MLKWHARLLFFALLISASAQSIVTVAGLPYSHRAAVDTKPALQAPLGNVHSLLFDRTSGRLLFTDQALLNRIEPDGSLLVVAGMGRGSDGDIADGTLASGLATIFGFDGLAQDAAGNIYVTELLGRVYRLERDGTVTTVAGGGTLAPGFASDGGPATAASLSSPRGTVFDSQGNLDIAEVFCHCIRRVSPAGIITTVYTIPQHPGPQAYDYFEGLSIDAQDNLYAAEYAGAVVLKIAPGGAATTIAGTGVAGYSGDGGPATAAQIDGPSSAVADASGNVYIADTHNNRIRRVAPDGTISTVIGTGQPGFSGDGGPASAAQINLPAQIVLDASGNLYFADFANNRVRRVGPDGAIATLAGSGIPDRNPIQYPQVGDGGPALSAIFSDPGPLLFDPSGNLLVSDVFNNRIRKIAPDSTVTTIVGNGQRDFLYAGGGPASQAPIIPFLLALDPSNTLYFTANAGAFRLNSDNTVALIAGGKEGTGPSRFQGDGGPAVNAIFNGMNGLLVDSQDNVFITDEINTRVREVNGATGIVNTIAGPGQSQPGVDYWGGLVADAQGNLYVATAHAQPPMVYAHVSRVNSDGTLTPIAGNEQPCSGGEFSYDGAPALQVPLCSIGFLSIDTKGVIYLGAYQVILAITPDGAIRRVAGKAPASTNILPHSNGDGGPPLNAEIPAGAIAFDAQGNMFISDGAYNRIREIIKSPVTPSFSKPSLTFSGSQSQSVSIQTNVAEPFPYSIGIQSGVWLTSNRVSGLTGDTLVVSSNPAGLPTGTYHATISTKLQNGATATLPVTLTVP